MTHDTGPRLVAPIARRALTPSLGRAGAGRVVHVAGERYRPPPPALARTSAGRCDVLVASCSLALRDALVESGRRAEEAVDLLAERRGQELLGAGTLAGGADRCDFRYVVRAGRGR